MSRKYLLLALMLLLVSSFVIFFGMTEAEFQGQILIRADGSIQPPDAPLTTFDNVTYVLAEDIAGSIVSQRSSIIVDGSERMLKGNGSDVGLNLTNVYNVTIKNLYISGFQQGVNVFSSSNCIISNNSVSGNSRYAIFLDNSDDNNIRMNTITNNGVGIVLWQNSCNNRIFENAITANLEYGVHIYKSSNHNHIESNNLITNSWDAIRIFESSNNTILNNHLIGNLAGVTLDYSSENTILNNSISDNSANGIGLASSYGNNVVENIISNNIRGLTFTNSSNNSLRRNHIFAHQLYGILLTLSNNNSAVHNNFRDNYRHAYASKSQGNSWDEGYPSGGNFWSDYVGPDADLDGIGDIPYEITSLDRDNITDNNPLMGTFYSYKAPQDDLDLISVVSNSTISAFRVRAEHSEGVAIRFNVSGQAGFGFCRMCIPKSLLAPPYTVVIDNGQTPLTYLNETTFDNDTYRWLYFAYPHTEHEVIIIAEFGQMATLVALLIASLSTTTVFGLKKEQNLTRSRDSQLLLKTSASSSS